MDLEASPDAQAVAEQRANFPRTLDDARAALAHGAGRVITPESVRQLAEEVKARGRTRLLAELGPPNL